MSTPTELRRRGLDGAEIDALLDEARKSSLSLAAFARSKNVPYGTLYSARRRRAFGAPTSEQGRGKRAGLLPVVLTGDPGSSSTGLLLRLPTGLVLEIQSGFDELTLRRVLGVLGSC
jgi:hypothetical protein